MDRSGTARSRRKKTRWNCDEPSMMSHRMILIWVAMLWAGATGLHAQATSQVTSQGETTTVRGRVEVIAAEGKAKTRHGAIPATVVWLTPMTGAGVEATTAIPASPPAN